jgi:hypothetical protein
MVWASRRISSPLVLTSPGFIQVANSVRVMQPEVPWKVSAQIYHSACK